MKKSQAVNLWYSPVFAEIIARNVQWDSGKRAWINAPFTFNGWACATDGHIILAVDDEVVPEVVVPQSELAGVGKKLVNYEANLAAVTDAQLLRVWCQRRYCKPCRNTREQECEICEGKKCEDCSQTGKEPCLDCVVNPGMLFSATLNRNLLGPLVERVPDAKIELRYRDPKDAVYLAGKSWRALIMPIRPDAYPNGVPEFTLKTKSVENGVSRE